ncbi:MAG: hypothetical protein PHX20_08240, partial [Candidatus Omnitrophica bacterium]|nr:hypothetical protein [Candidatus Omnitrophota bacterium]
TKGAIHLSSAVGNRDAQEFYQFLQRFGLKRKVKTGPIEWYLEPDDARSFIDGVGIFVAQHGISADLPEPPAPLNAAPRVGSEYRYGDDRYRLELEQLPFTAEDSYDIKVRKNGGTDPIGGMSIVIDDRGILITSINVNNPEDRGRDIESRMMKMAGDHFASQKGARCWIVDLDTLLDLYCALPHVSENRANHMRERVDRVNTTQVTRSNFIELAGQRSRIMRELAHAIIRNTEIDDGARAALQVVLPGTRLGRILRAGGFSENMRVELERVSGSYKLRLAADRDSAPQTLPTPAAEPSPATAELASRDPGPTVTQAFKAALKIVHYLKETKTEVIVISGVEAPMTTTLLQQAWVKLFGDAKFPVIYWIRPEVESTLLHVSDKDRLANLKKIEGLEWLRSSKALYLSLTDNNERELLKLKKAFDDLGFTDLDFGFLLASRGVRNPPGRPFVIATYDETSARHMAMLAGMIQFVEFDDQEEVYLHFFLLDKILSKFLDPVAVSTDLLPESVLARRPAGVTDLAIKSAEEPQDELPAMLTARGYKLIQSYGRGGSSSYTYLAENAEGRRVVIKYSDWEGISGNGTPWIVRQVEKLKRIETGFPEAARGLYPKVLDFYHEGDIAYYAMECFDGAMDITKYYFYDPFVNPEDIYQSVDSFVTLMADTHYKHDLEVYPDELKTNVLKRMRYRTGLLTRHEGEIYDRLIKGRSFKVGEVAYPDASYFFGNLMAARYVTINGKVYPNLPILMDILEKNGPALQQRLGPTHYTPFSHGDLPLRNVLLLPDKSARIIDVRGQNIHETSPSKTSVEYDLAKIAHGFLLELVRNGYYTLDASQGGAGFEFKYRFFNYPGNTRYQAMR